MRREVRFLIVGLLIAAGLVLLLIGLLSPPPPCCLLGSGMHDCGPCLQPLFPNTAAVEVGVLLLLLGLIGLVLVRQRRMQWANSPPH